MRHRAPILSLSVVANSTARHSLVNGFITSRRHEVHCTSKHNHPFITSTTRTTESLPTSYSSLHVLDRRQQNADNNVNDMTYNSNDFQCLSSHFHNRFRKFRSSPQHAPHIRRVVLLSDLHMDYTANREWLSNLCNINDEVDGGASPNDYLDSSGNNIDHKNTMMIVAGDVSHDMEILRWTFQTLKRKYGEVAYTPGNHELWIDRDANADGNIVQNTSIDKLERVLQLCLEENIRIGPVRVGGDSYDNESGVQSAIASLNNGSIGNAQPKLWVIPLLSWHHPSFDTEPPIECWGGIPSARKVVADYRRTRWPSPLSLMDDSIAHFIDSLNDIILDLDGIAEVETTSMVMTTPIRILTFSHFIPRIELLPEKRYLSLPTLPRCVGSTFLERRLRRMGGTYCIFVNDGSTHDKERINNNLHDHDTTIISSGSNIWIGSNNGGNNSSSSSGDTDINGSLDGTTENQNHHHLHAFGHTHLAWDATIDGVRYVHVPLAYPREWEQRRRSLEIGSMNGEVGEDRFPVCLWEQTSIRDADVTSASSSGFPSQWLGGWWSKYYSVMPRKPEKNKELAPWVAKRFRPLPGGQIETFDHVSRSGAIDNVKDQ
ncbi:hypothetical protein ACHAXH_002342 [Discostella pseudostelligera]